MPYAYGIDVLESKDFIVAKVKAPSMPKATEQSSFCATGLGMAGSIEDDSGIIPFACEGGHADFAPRTIFRWIAWAISRRNYGRISV